MHNGGEREQEMSLSHRFRQTAAILLVHHYNKQEGLAVELRTLLKLSKKIDLRPVVCRFIGGGVVHPGYFEAIPLLFWRDIVAGDYPQQFLSWLDRAYVSYDLDNSLGKRDKTRVRTLLAEADLLFQSPKMSNTKTDDPFSRAEATRYLMRGIAIGVEHRTLGVAPERIKEGLNQLQIAIRGYRSLRPRESSLTESDKFHIACAVHMAGWLLSELKDESFRKRTLDELNAMGAIDAYAWLAEKSENWVHIYNVAENYGEIGDRAAQTFLLKAIELNPRLADFDLETKFDGVDEPLSKAPALLQVLPEISRNKKGWLEERKAAYRRNAEIYQEDVTKGIKAMLKDLKTMEAAKVAMKYKIATAGLVIVVLTASDLLLQVAAALAKPIF
jgi:hypothetical protein